MMKVVIVLALLVATATAAFPNANCNGESSTELSAPVFVADGSKIDSTSLVLKFDVDQRFETVKFEFASGSQAAVAGGYCNSEFGTAAGPFPLWANAAPAGTEGTSMSDPNCASSDYRFTATFLPGEALGKCFTYDATSDPNFVLYSATVKITTTQARTKIRNVEITRTTTTAVLLRFRFQRFINVTANSVTVVGNGIIYSDIVEQTFISDSTATDFQKTKVVLLTSVQQPYQLSRGDVPVQANNGFTIDTTTTAQRAVGLFQNFAGNNGQNGANAGTCTAAGVNNAGLLTTVTASTPNACIQKWEAWLVAPANTCFFATNVTFRFTVGCAPDFVGSCSGASPTTYTIEYELTSNDFCPKVVADIGLSGTLVPYGVYPTDPTNPGTPLFNYLFGQTVFFLASVTATAGPDIVLTQFVSGSVITVSDNAVPFRIDFSAGGSSSFGFTHWSYETNPTFAGFKFLVDENTVRLDNPDAAQPVTVTAEFRVTYQNLNSEKFELASPTFTPQAMNQANLGGMKVDVSISRPATTASGSSSLVAMVAGIAAGCVALTAFVAFFLYRRATNKFAEEVSAPVDPKELEAIEKRLEGSSTSV